MGLALHLTACVVLVIMLQSHVLCDGSTSTGGDADQSDSSSIPILASGKRQHNIMRFGKRPAGGHNLIHFGKRGDGSKPPQHSFLYFGKREDMDPEALPDVLQYLQRNRDNSYKRGHTIMRFGKRGVPDNHNFIRFGKREGDEDYDGYYQDVELAGDDSKRNGHSMMYFGKRDGHSMLYFGKRNGHSILSFGKRDSDDNKRAHAMIHFGKRDDDEDVASDGKRAHSMIHFGKRTFEEDGIAPIYWSPETSEDKRDHNLLRFGKKTEGNRKGSHAMIHFGKRSVDQHQGSVLSGNESDKEVNDSNKAMNRMKRDIGQTTPPVTIIGYDGSDDAEDEIPYLEEDLQGAPPGSPLGPSSAFWMI